ncbi:MAG: hypothetical protein SOV57_00615 [Bacilli bacterium]|nr:hypothetical protein [Erysipelotrichaceae bacterium]MDD6250657.1 hypothetical protein [Bacillales bacterium]MDY2745698.1 hypothetical protein [Bacilli bacterium]MDD7381397.1 hypothetical protein [Bacillales bacterium]MDY3890771.1 hypothetical protein [Bacilli bacterium]
MNQTTRFVMGIYQVSLMIRDALEYIQNKETFDLNVYKQRKQFIEHGLIESAPLSRFLSQNGDVGKNIRNNLNDFVDAVYGDDSTIVSIDGEKVVSDKGQKLKMLDFIVGLHETLQDVMKGFINQSKNDNTYEEELDTFLKYDEKFFRSLLCINLVDQIHALFLDFNKAMQQSKGEPGPATNFILNDLKRVVGFLKFENEHADKEDEGFKKAYDASFLMLQYMEGSKKAEDEGTTIKDQIVEARKLWQVEIGKNEPEWRTRYQILWDKLVAFEQEEAAKRRAQ